jgi:hypothetical protein
MLREDVEETGTFSNLSIQKSQLFLIPAKEMHVLA